MYRPINHIDGNNIDDDDGRISTITEEQRDVAVLSAWLVIALMMVAPLLMCCAYKCKTKWRERVGLLFPRVHMRLLPTSPFRFA
jgi:hypothetical protein